MRLTTIPALAVTVLFIATFAVSTVAITAPADQVTEDVALEPTTQYTSLTADGDLKLDFDALNERATTTVDEAFAIIASDDVEAVWIDHDVSGLEFYTDAPGDESVSDSSPLEPAAGETTTVGVALDTRDAPTGTETFTVHIATAEDDPAAVSLESLAVEPTDLETGENVSVTATYRNDGGTTETVTAELTVDGVVVAQQPVAVGPGKTETVTFERPMQWPGSYAVGVDDVASEPVTVEGPPIEVLEAEVADVDLIAGDTAMITATATNPTETAVERTLEFSVDGVVVDTRTVVLEPESETTVIFERDFDEAGTYDLAVSGVAAGTITVGDADPYLIQNRELSGPATAALGPPLAIGLLLMFVAANRRWGRPPFR